MPSGPEWMCSLPPSEQPFFDKVQAKDECAAAEALHALNGLTQRYCALSATLVCDDEGLTRRLLMSLL